MHSNKKLRCFQTRGDPTFWPCLTVGRVIPDHHTHQETSEAYQRICPADDAASSHLCE